MKRSELWSLGGIVGVVVGLLVWSIIAGNSILLGIDLDGGVEVGLVPVEDSELEGEALDEALDTSVAVLRNRVDGLGVAEPDITRQGNRIVVQLPGVEDQQRAIEIVGATAELRFRPVCASLPAEPLDLTAAAPEGEDGVDDGTTEDGAVDGETETPEEAEPEPTVAPQPVGISPLDVDPEPTPEGTGAEGGDADATPTGPLPVGCENIDINEIEAFSMESTTREDDESDVAVILPDVDLDGNITGRFLLGRTFCADAQTLGIDPGEIAGDCRELTGTALEDADASFQGFEWAVLPNFKGGSEGIDLFNAAASACFNGLPSCPTGNLAIVLDGIVLSAPTVQTPFFERNAVNISGSFTEAEAEDVALKIKFGALPIEFEDPADPDSLSTVNNVSATLGRDSLRSGVIAGIVGFTLVAVYMIAYYRLLGVAAILSLVVSGTLTWVTLAYLSASNGLALTLAGVVGLIVSIGTSLDSNVVYFEHLKEDIANGRTLRSSVDRSFPVAFKTIFYANMASLIGAVILWFLTVGSVKGFALVLGLASVLDLIATYFFLRPFVRFMARSAALREHPRRFGLPHAQPIEVSS